MKYTLPKSYKHAGVQVEIDDTWLRKTKEAKGSTKAAIDQWLFENGYMDKDELAKQPAPVQKAKRERKPDETKRSLISAVYAYLTSLDGPYDVKVTNPERIVAFSLGDDCYELTLTRKRKTK